MELGEPLRLLALVELLSAALLALTALAAVLRRRLVGPRPPPLAGRVALVTSGDTELGRALCLRLAEEGCHVARIVLPNRRDVIDMNTSDKARDVNFGHSPLAAEELLGRIHTFECAGTTRADVEKLWRLVHTKLDAISIVALISNLEDARSGQPNAALHALADYVNTQFFYHLQLLRCFSGGKQARDGFVLEAYMCTGDMYSHARSSLYCVNFALLEQLIYGNLSMRVTRARLRAGATGGAWVARTADDLVRALANGKRTVTIPALPQYAVHIIREKMSKIQKDLQNVKIL